MYGLDPVDARFIVDRVPPRRMFSPNTLVVSVTVIPPKLRTDVRFDIILIRRKTSEGWKSSNEAVLPGALYKYRQDRGF
jgi:hypothetical protein